MTSTSIPTPAFSTRDRSFPDATVFIIGAGHFGQRAARILSLKPELSLVLIDQDQSRLEKINNPNAIKIRADGIRFLAEQAAFLKPGHRIIPALPVHLALKWLKLNFEDKNKERNIKQLPIPKQIISTLPHAWEGSEGSLLASYADFICPDDCPEPAENCTVTGKRRPKPLHELLMETQVPGFDNHVIVSRQLAPGLGGYTVAELHNLFERLQQTESSKWLIATACKCHGIITAIATA